MGFIDSLLFLPEMDSLTGIEIDLFDEEDDPILVEAREYNKGLIKVTYLPLPRNPQVRFLDDSIDSGFMEIQDDTIYYWHKDMVSDSLMIETSFDGRIDTSKVRRAKKTMSEIKFRAKDNPLNISKRDTIYICLLYTSPSPRDATLSRMPSSA